jgi:hypothetical protein
MNIKINNKDYKIKSALELTVKEYVEIFNGITEESSQYDILIRYISVVTGLPYRNVADISISPNSIRRLFAYIGEIPQVKDMPELKQFYYKRKGRMLYRSYENWRTLGVMRMIEQKKVDTQIEQAVYLLAIYLTEDYDNDKVNKVYEDLQSYNAIEVLGFIIFFFKNLYNGEKTNQNSSKKHKKKASTNIVIL